MKKTVKVPLVLLHGFPLDSSMWDGQKDYFKEKWPMLSPDLPGFGMNRKKAPETIEGFAKGVKAFFDEKGLKKAVIAGFSMGGYVAFAFYEMFPELVEALVFIDTRAGADSDSGKAGRDSAIRSLEAEGVKWLADGMPPKLLSEGGMKDESILETVRNMIIRQKPQAVRNALVAMRDRKDRTSVLAKIHCPALFICGENDFLTPPEEMISMVNDTKGGSFALIKNAGHLSNMENPGAFDEALLEFLEELK